MDTFWAGILGSVVGALASLVATFLTQRFESERRAKDRQHEATTDEKRWNREREMEERATVRRAYADCLSGLSGLQTILGEKHRNEPISNAEARYAVDAKQSVATLLAHVNHADEGAERKLYWFLSAPMEFDLASGSVEIGKIVLQLMRTDERLRLEVKRSVGEDPPQISERQNPV